MERGVDVGGQGACGLLLERQDEERQVYSVRDKGVLVGYCFVVGGIREVTGVIRMRNDRSIPGVWCCQRTFAP